MPNHFGQAPASGTREAFAENWRILPDIVRCQTVPNRKDPLFSNFEGKETIEFQLGPALGEKAMAHDHDSEALELTRFGGHPMVGAERSVHDAEEPSAVRAGVPGAAHRAGSQRANA